MGYTPAERNKNSSVRLVTKYQNGYPIAITRVYLILKNSSRLFFSTQAEPKPRENNLDFNYLQYVV